MDIGWTLEKNPINLHLKNHPNQGFRERMGDMSREELIQLIKMESIFILNLCISLEHILGTLKENNKNEINKQLINFIDELLNGN